MHVIEEGNQSKNATYYMIPTIITFSKRQNYEGRKKINGCQG